jgi:beta-phosphoglucomutase family hydrolase
MLIKSNIKALIFDCDGTLADTMPAHYLAWREVTRANGADFPEDIFYQTGGMPGNKVVQLLNDRFGYQLNPQQITHDKEVLFYEKYVPQSQPIEPVVAIARQYQDKLPMAIATGGFRHIATKILKLIQIWDWFDTMVTSEDVVHGKPAPDTYLEAARRLNVLPAQCHAFEDSDPGIESARRAGMTVTDVRKLLHNGNQL